MWRLGISSGLSLPTLPDPSLTCYDSLGDWGKSLNALFSVLGGNMRSHICSVGYIVRFSSLLLENVLSFLGEKKKKSKQKENEISNSEGPSEINYENGLMLLMIMNHSWFTNHDLTWDSMSKASTFHHLGRGTTKWWHGGRFLISSKDAWSTTSSSSWLFWLSSRASAHWTQTLNNFWPCWDPPKDGDY